ncbi:hypothetical protein G6F70_003523 [Rhizopus microsporus]|nr:hypothetical protein G6F71_003518 [Rhizopus microsporus]KAG1201027.1 hypothetical protein G6F70_003523 [Rhizopus microsporus]KAG1212877.1 hypothetical protein G6F69_003317 [Rhizopus microsporus]KAG1234857.1 hypothetical protein G6F67_003211 [Rhizopus microsporus]KAG1267099.1 hypothetical protein G6F68_002212 [Rhizopus microsporus]
MLIININDNLATCIIPKYDDDVATICFVNEAGFEEWFSNIAQKHANWNLHQAPLRLHIIKYNEEIRQLKNNPEGLDNLVSTLRQSISIVENVCSVPQSRPARQQ